MLSCSSGLDAGCNKAGEAQGSLLAVTSVTFKYTLNDIILTPSHNGGSFVIDLLSGYLMWATVGHMLVTVLELDYLLRPVRQRLHPGSAAAVIH